ncbi:MAG TPA: isochorismatase family protein [Sphingomicrobium sp.]|jgi:nicotinamidase-related amidase|nr:isochorismatase family protein [Sphingomicrobium sp.]
MTVTTLDLKTAFVIIDLQKGLVSYPTIQPVPDVAAKASFLAKAFRERGLPVVLVNVAGRAPGRTEQPRPTQHPPTDWAELLPELNAQESDIRVTKRTWGAFPHTDLESKLREAGVTQIVVAGVATSIGVESTAREAYGLGFNVTLATDAMTDMDEAAHENSVQKIFPKLGETGTVKEIVELLDGR